jgi:hypothetical protein
MRRDRDAEAPASLTRVAEPHAIGDTMASGSGASGPAQTVVAAAPSAPFFGEPSALTAAEARAHAAFRDDAVPPADPAADGAPAADAPAASGVGAVPPTPAVAAGSATPAGTPEAPPSRDEPRSPSTGRSHTRPSPGRKQAPAAKPQKPPRNIDLSVNPFEEKPR